GLFDATPVFMRSPLFVGSLRNRDADGHLYRYDVVDMNGDGLPDIVDARGWRSCVGGSKAGAYCSTGAQCPGGSCALTNQCTVCRNSGTAQTANAPAANVPSFTCSLWSRNVPLRLAGQNDEDQGLLVDTFDLTGDGQPDTIDLRAQNAMTVWYSQPAAAP